MSGLLTVPFPAPVGQHHPPPERGRRAGGCRCEGGRLRRKGRGGGCAAGEAEPLASEGLEVWMPLLLDLGVLLLQFGVHTCLVDAAK